MRNWKNDALTFELTEDHLKLMRRMYVCWDDCEYGAPAIDPKRPYGNSSVEVGIGEILGEEPEDPDNEFSEQQCERYRVVHLEMQTALQIILTTGSFSSGTYTRPNAYSDWGKELQ